MGQNFIEPFSAPFNSPFIGPYAAKSSLVEYWDENYRSFLVGAELIAGSTDFMDTVDSPWTWDTDRYKIDGSQPVHKYMVKNSVVTIGAYYRMGMTIDDYVDGDFAYAVGTAKETESAGDVYFAFKECAGSVNFWVSANGDGDGSVMDFSLREQTAGIGVGSWVGEGDNLVDVDESGLNCEIVSTGNGMKIYLRSADDLTSDLEVGKEYTLTMDFKSKDGTSSRFKVYDGSGDNTSDATTSQSFVPLKVTFTAGHATNCYVIFSVGVVGEVFWIKDLSLIG